MVIRLDIEKKKRSDRSWLRRQDFPWIAQQRTECEATVGKGSLLFATERADQLGTSQRLKQIIVQIGEVLVSKRIRR